MRFESIRLKTLLPLVGALILALTSPPISAGETAPALAVNGVVVDGTRIQAHVANSSGAAASGAVVARALLRDGSLVTVSLRVTVVAGAVVWLPLALPDEVREVIAVGVVLDDGSPFGPI